MKRLVLVGAGHAHLVALHQLWSHHATQIKAQTKNLELILISPDIWQYYSGMLPGFMAGHYNIDACRINVSTFTQMHGIRFIQLAVNNIDPVKRCVYLSDGQIIPYDLLSIDIGCEIDSRSLAQLDECFCPVKPLSQFHLTFEKIIQNARHQSTYHLVIAGAGAAGVELAIAAHHRLQQVNPNTKVTLFTGTSGIMPSHSISVQTRVKSALNRLNITLVEQRAVIENHQLINAHEPDFKYDYVIGATGSHAPTWLKQTPLALDQNGYILVDQYQRCTSYPDIFAAGDICARTDIFLEKSGVHAVHAGPILAHNILASLSLTQLKAFYPRKHSLYLIACDGQSAIMSWGKFSAEGRWVWRWKNHIDQKFMAQFDQK